MSQIKLRRDTLANFTSSNPVLGSGEPAYETDTKKLKIGDGSTAYTQLAYFSSGGGDNYTAGSGIGIDENNVISTKLYAPSKFTVVGSPTITSDGIASGFSKDNYLTIPEIPLVTASNWEIIIPIRFDTLDSQVLLTGTTSNSISFGLWNDQTTSYAYAWLSSTHFDTSFNPQINTTYFMKYSYRNGTAYLDVSTDGTIYTNYGSLEVSIDSSWKNPSVIGGSSYPLNGSIDLKSLSITVDGEEVFNGSQDIYQALDSSPYITETYVNGTSWYRVYSDGWCEQGGYTTNDETSTSLLKSYKDTNYILQFTSKQKDTTLGNNSYISKTTSSFIADFSSSSAGVDWLALGYIS